MRQITIVSSITDRSEDSLSKYLSEIKKYPIMGIDEEVETARAAHKEGNAGETARKKLVTSNLRFVVSVAKSYQHMGLSLSDLINEGNIGLITAAEKFDETRGFKFISYAIWWIRQSIIKAISERGSMVKRPTSAIAISGRINRATEKFFQQNGRTPSAEELSEIVSLEISAIEESLQGRAKVASMDKCLDDEDGMTYGDTFAAQVESTDNSTEYSIMQKELAKLLTSILDRKEKKVIFSCFGIGCTEKGLESIAGEMRITKERVRQIKDEALRKIRGCNAMREFARYIA